MTNCEICGKPYTVEEAKAKISQLQAWVREQKDEELRAVYTCKCGSIKIAQCRGYVRQKEEIVDAVLYTYCVDCNRNLTEAETEVINAWMLKSD